jgi:hypothetical protein
MNGSFVATGATGTALGTGLTNTDAIISVQGAPAASYAAGWARAYKGGGYADWYLPSKDELNKLHVKRKAIGGSWRADYWSSSEINAQFAWDQAFVGGPQLITGKFHLGGVRAVWTF